jgi:hypothetical protein
MLTAPTTISDAAILAASLLSPLAQLGPARAMGAFENAATSIAGPIVRQVEFASNPLLPNFIVTLHSSGQVVLWLDGVDQPSQIPAFLGLLPDSGFRTLGGKNDSVQSYAANIVNAVRMLKAPAQSPAFAIGYSLGGAALAVYIGTLGALSPIDLLTGISVGAPKPGATGDFQLVGAPRFYRFWSVNDPVPALPPAATDAPVAASVVPFAVAWNWNQQEQAGSGVAIDFGAAPVSAIGGRTNAVSNLTNLAGVFGLTKSRPVQAHSIQTYIAILSQSASGLYSAQLLASGDLLSKPQLLFTPAELMTLLGNPAFVKAYQRERAMVPRVIIPPLELPTVELYLSAYAVVWQGQVLCTFGQLYAAKILVKAITKVMKRASLSSGLSQAAWTAAVVSWVANLQSIGGGYSPQPPAL